MGPQIKEPIEGPDGWELGCGEGEDPAPGDGNEPWGTSKGDDGREEDIWQGH